MSYILDALKKAEEERRRGVAPDVMTVQEIRSVKERNLRPVFVYLLVAALLLNIGMLAWWLGPWHGERQVKTGHKAEGERMMTTADRARDVLDPGATVISLPDEKKGSGVSGRVSSPADSEEKLPPADKSTARKKSNPATADVKGNVAETPRAEPSIKAGIEDEALQPPAGNRIYDMNQLPSSIRQDLPALRMSLHYFTDDPSMRLVRINGETWREGQKMSDGLKLDEITADGAVFDYRNYRFRIIMQPQ